MDWFESLFGFKEGDYARTRAQFVWDGATLTSRANGRSWRVGEFETPSLADLRSRCADAAIPRGVPRVRVLHGDVKRLHAAPEYAGALFQVASQFNALEMVGPNVTPEQGVTRYQSDPTQGPACALSAAPALIVRNYFAPVCGGVGQTRDRQLDGLAEVGDALAASLDTRVASLWRMSNGYALAEAEGLAAIDRHLGALDEAALDSLRGLLRVAIQRGVEVTAPGAPEGHLVSQVFCSALPVAYCRHPNALWARFATLVLEAAYEATFREAALSAARGGSNLVLLTLLGGGAFGNDEAWIFQAIRRATQVCAQMELDIRIVSYAPPGRELLAFADSLGR